MKKSHLQQGHRCPFSLILALVILGQIGFDIYLPSLPMIAQSLHTTISLTQLSLTTYLLSMGVSQLFYGPISDSYGRKKVIVFAVILYIIASALCLSAHHIDFFLVSRFLQGFAAGATIVIARAILRDNYEGKALTKASIYLSMVWALVPIIAPVIGGYLQLYVGWRSNFAVLVLFSVFCLLFIMLKLPNKKGNKKQSVHNNSLLGNMYLLITHRQFIGYLLAPALIYSASMAYVSVIPIIFQKKLGISVNHTGLLIMVTTLFYLLGNIANRLLINRLSANKTIKIGIVFSLAATVSLMIASTLGYLTVSIIIIPFIVYYFSIGLVFANCVAKALSDFPKMAGTASALVGCIQILMGAMSTALMSHFSSLSLTPLAIYVLIAMLLSCFSIFIIARRNSIHKPFKQLIQS